jgi:hypothetical protein
VVMGGEMSVNDEREFPWLTQEKTLIREFIAKGRPVRDLPRSPVDSCGGRSEGLCLRAGTGMVTRIRSLRAGRPRPQTVHGLPDAWRDI